MNLTAEITREEVDGEPTDQVAAANGQAASPGAPEGARQYVTFLVDDRAYGVDIKLVREIKQWSPTTGLPRQPRHMRGVLNLRGTIVPVLDLRAFFGGALTEPTETHVIVIVWIGDRTVGVLVDAVSDINAVANEEVRPVPSGEIGAEGTAISGLVSTEGGMIALLDLDILLGFERQAAN